MAYKVGYRYKFENCEYTITPVGELFRIHLFLNYPFTVGKMVNGLYADRLRVHNIAKSHIIDRLNL